MRSKPTLTDGVDTITLEHPIVSGLNKGNLQNTVVNETMGGRTFIQRQYYKREYSLSFKNLDRTYYTEIYDFLNTAYSAGRSITFNYSEKWTEADDVLVFVELSEESSDGGDMCSFSLNLKETIGIS